MNLRSESSLSPFNPTRQGSEFGNLPPNRLVTIVTWGYTETAAVFAGKPVLIGDFRSMAVRTNLNCFDCVAIGGLGTAGIVSLRVSSGPALLPETEH